MNRNLFFNTTLVALSFTLAAGMGLVRNMIVASQFGLGTELDAFYAAFKLPDLLFTVVAGGALATAFIPVFSCFLAEDDHDSAWRLASAITNLVVLVVSVLALLAIFAAPWLVGTLIAPGFDVAQQAETASIMRIVLLSTLFFAISAVQSSALHSFKHFLLPALAPVVYPLGIIVGALWLTPTWGVRGLAMGAVLGAFLHLAVKIPALWYYGFRWWPVLGLRTPAVHRVLVLMGPRVLDLGVFHATLLAMTNLASRLDPGSVSALEWGWEFMQLPETILGTAFGLVIFPTFAELAARNDINELRNTLRQALQVMIVLTVPAAAGLILLGQPLLQLVYQRGAFDATATAAVFIALQFFALGLVGHTCLELVARLFFAQQDTVTPLIVAMGAGLLHIALAIFLMGPLGHGGLALSNSIAITLEVLTLLVILRRRLGGLDVGQILKTLGRVVIATGLMSVVVWGLNMWLQQRGWSTVWILLFGSATGGIVYLIIGWLLSIHRHIFTK